MPAKKSKGKKKEDDDDEASGNSVIVEFTLSDGKFSVPCAIHNGPDNTLEGGCADADEFKKSLSETIFRTHTY